MVRFSFDMIGAKLFYNINKIILKFELKKLYYKFDYNFDVDNKINSMIKNYKYSNLK